jgi:hypothetical protein
MAEESGFNSWKEREIFVSSVAPRLAVTPTCAPIQLVPVALSFKIKRLGYESDHMEQYFHSPICLQGVMSDLLLYVENIGGLHTRRFVFA